MSDNEMHGNGGGGAGGDDDVSLPKATIAKFVQEILPNDMTCTREARDLISKSASAFITLVSAQANEICEKESKKTISPEHIESSLKKLGFNDYIEELHELLVTHKQDAKQERQKRASKLEKSGLTQEELLRQQEMLFAESRARYEAGGEGGAEEEGGEEKTHDDSKEKEKGDDDEGDDDEEAEDEEGE